jgi:hypothetical protein
MAVKDAIHAIKSHESHPFEGPVSATGRWCARLDYSTLPGCHSANVTLSLGADVDAYTSQTLQDI